MIRHGHATQASSNPGSRLAIYGDRGQVWACGSSHSVIASGWPWHASSSCARLCTVVRMPSIPSSSASLDSRPVSWSAAACTSLATSSKLVAEAAQLAWKPRVLVCQARTQRGGELLHLAERGELEAWIWVLAHASPAPGWDQVGQLQLAWPIGHSEPSSGVMLLSVPAVATSEVAYGCGQARFLKEKKLYTTSAATEYTTSCCEVAVVKTTASVPNAHFSSTILMCEPPAVISEPSRYAYCIKGPARPGRPPTLAKCPGGKVTVDGCGVPSKAGAGSFPWELGAYPKATAQKPDGCVAATSSKLTSKTALQICMPAPHHGTPTDRLVTALPRSSLRRCCLTCTTVRVQGVTGARIPRRGAMLTLARPSQAKLRSATPQRGVAAGELLAARVRQQCVPSVGRLQPQYTQSRHHINHIDVVHHVRVRVVAWDCFEAGAEVRVRGQHSSDCCAWPSVLAFSRQAAAQLQVRDGCLGNWDVRVHGLALLVELVGYVQGKQVPNEEAQQPGRPITARSLQDFTRSSTARRKAAHSACGRGR
ncbi:hypothetical protein HaLaN_05146 [Haematococcus lacustris]|uniref:Uncharacterized protein n=1 Tax=Haematococcus lacustris TaxID=44745 RepID=A0A699YI93_HAELA|nr:hypothetical protein HaLaN_05146 [Haematococcus lacustris]